MALFALIVWALQRLLSRLAVTDPSADSFMGGLFAVAIVSCAAEVVAFSRR